MEPIVMVSLDQFKQPRDGKYKYLVKTTTQHSGEHFFDTFVTVTNGKPSIDAQHQIVLAISFSPLKTIL